MEVLSPEITLDESKSLNLGSNAPFNEKLLPVAHSQTMPMSSADRNLLSLYLQEMARTPLLTPEEEKELATRVFDHKDPKAFQKLVQSNLRFVVKIAFEYVRYGSRILDLIQEGNMGLIKAVQDFNPYKEVRLTTYAVWWIRSYIQDFLLRNWSLVRIGTTAAQKKLFYRLRKEQEKFERQGMIPEVQAIAHELNVDKNDVEMMQLRLAGGDVSLNSPVNHASAGENESNLSFIGRIPDNSELASDVLDANEQATLFKKALGDFVQHLDEREKAIFQQRMMSEHPRTLLEIGEEFGFSKERARQLEERVKAKLKDFLSEKYPDISLN